MSPAFITSDRRATGGLTLTAYPLPAGSLEEKAAIRRRDVRRVRRVLKTKPAFQLECLGEDRHWSEAQDKKQPEAPQSCLCRKLHITGHTPHHLDVSVGSAITRNTAEPAHCVSRAHGCFSEAFILT